jgi:hypothetical protein
MFGFFNSNKTITKDVSSELVYDSDSVYEKEPTCVIQSQSVIVSNLSSDRSKIKFGYGSFSFTVTDEKTIILQFHPIFLWRFVLLNESIKNDTEIVDFTRLRSFASRFMRNRGFDICFTVSECDIRYIMDGIIVVKSVSSKVFAKVIELFNKLHMSLSRQYDSCELIDSMLDAGFQVLRIVSGV